MGLYLRQARRPLAAHGRNFCRSVRDERADRYRRSQKAKEYGTVVSYDLNYRPSLWKGIGGQEKAQQVNREIAKYIDVMIGNEEDFTACLGLEVEGNDAGLKKLNVEGYCK